MVNDDLDFEQNLLESVLPESYFDYPEGIFISPVIMMLRTWCTQANELRRSLALFWQNDEICNYRSQPLPIMVLSAAAVRMIDWLGKYYFIPVVYVCVLLVFPIVSLAIRFHHPVSIWLSSGFPFHMLIACGVGLLFLFAYCLMRTMQKDYGTLKEARKASTVDKHIYLKERDKHAEQMLRLLHEMKQTGKTLGIPMDYCMYADKIWAYICEGRADSVAEVIKWIEKEEFLNQIGNRNSIEDTALQFLKNIYSQMD